MNHHSVTRPSPDRSHSHAGSRRRRAGRHVSAVAAAATLVTLGATAPAHAGIPDAGQIDYLRTPIFTSLVMDPAVAGGYWTQVDASYGGGGTRAEGGAPNLGNFVDAGGYIAATPSGRGLYFIDEDGEMQQIGDATAAPSNISKVSDYYTNNGDGVFYNPISSLAVTPSGKGGWVLDTTGEVWTFGDAVSFGSPGSHTTGQAVDLVVTSTGKGYTIVTNTGDTYSYGDAVSYGHPSFSSSTLPGTRQATGIALTGNDKGYWIVDSRGGIHPFGNANHLGDNPDPGNSFGKLSSDIAAMPDGFGYAIVQADGTTTVYDDYDVSAPSITSASATVFHAGRSNTFKVTATPGTRSITATGRLPHGVTLKDRRTNTATLSGTPTRRSAGTYTITFTAKTATGAPIDKQRFTLRVMPKR